MKSNLAKWLFMSGILALAGCRTTAPGNALKGDASAESEWITVDVNQVIHAFNGSPLGIDLNYIVDADANRPHARPLSAAIKDMGVRFMRYPGGEKSDYQFWSTSPWNKPNPQVFGYYRNYVKNILDFDAYIAAVRSAGGEPYVVVGYDNPKNTGKSKQEYLTNAVEWVRYANIKKGYGVKYWEIGNENWHNGTGSGAALAAIVTEFAQAMKAVDPSIKVGASGAVKASGDGSPFWQPFLQNGGSRNLDFLVATNYPCQSDGCENYRNNAQRNLDWVGDTTAAIANYAPAEDKDRLRVIVSEYNSIVWTNKWSNENDMIHALTSFDMLGQLIKQPKLDGALFWTTRWLPGGGLNVMYALDDNNNLTAQGEALKIWGTYMQDQLVSAYASGLSAAYALCAPDKKRIVVLIVNKEGSARQAGLVVKNLDKSVNKAEHHLFSADNGSSWSPSLSDGTPVALVDGQGSLSLPPYSITILDFHG